MSISGINWWFYLSLLSGFVCAVSAFVLNGLGRRILSLAFLTVALVAMIILGLAISSARAGTLHCSESGCGTMNWNQIYQREQAAKLRNLQGQQRVCQNIRASGRVALPAACR